jgi:hypothetical protein
VFLFGHVTATLLVFTGLATGIALHQLCRHLAGAADVWNCLRRFAGRLASWALRAIWVHRWAARQGSIRLPPSRKALVRAASWLEPFKAAVDAMSRPVTTASASATSDLLSAAWLTSAFIAMFTAGFGHLAGSPWSTLSALPIMHRFGRAAWPIPATTFRPATLCDRPVSLR